MADKALLAALQRRQHNFADGGAVQPATAQPAATSPSIGDRINALLNSGPTATDIGNAASSAVDRIGSYIPQGVKDASDSAAAFLTRGYPGATAQDRSGALGRDLALKTLLGMSPGTAAEGGLLDSLTSTKLPGTFTSPRPASAPVPTAQGATHTFLGDWLPGYPNGKGVQVRELGAGPRTSPYASRLVELPNGATTLVAPEHLAPVR